MKRLFFMFMLCLLLMFTVLKTLNVHLITPLSDSIKVRIVYHNQNHWFELEPYTLLSEVLETMDLDDDVDFRRLNLNLILAHNDVLTLPIITAEPCIAINTATFEELIQIKGVGKATALSILEYRNTTGLFHKLEDLLNIKGIGEAKFTQMKDALCL